MECPVCIEVYKTPLLLPGCGHTLCKSCAQMMITRDNFLTCPECRLVHKLIHGIQSLPKNVALEKTIEEQQQTTAKANLAGNIMCTDHPEDAVSLYCKTCDQSICLKCYFSGTLRRGFHTGHQVDTSEDAHSRERRLLEEKKQSLDVKRDKELEYIDNLSNTHSQLRDILNEKLTEIDKKKTELISCVKKTAAKVNFTLRGSMARDSELLDKALRESREHVIYLTDTIEKTDNILKQDHEKQLDVKILKQARESIYTDDDERAEPEHLPLDNFLKIQTFDTDLYDCIQDQERALAYQTDPPSPPVVVLSECIISGSRAYIAVQSKENVRAKTVSVFYKQSQYKGLSEKQYDICTTEKITCGRAVFILTGLDLGKMYRLYATARNNVGDSKPSKEVWFRTSEEEPEIRLI